MWDIFTGHSAQIACCMFGKLSPNISISLQKNHTSKALQQSSHLFVDPVLLVSLQALNIPNSATSAEHFLHANIYQVETSISNASSQCNRHVNELTKQHMRSTATPEGKKSAVERMMLPFFVRWRETCGQQQQKPQ